jgi:hypothetical protein
MQTERGELDGVFGTYTYDDPDMAAYISLLKCTLFSICCDIRQGYDKLDDDQHLQFFAAVWGFCLSISVLPRGFCVFYIGNTGYLAKVTSVPSMCNQSFRKNLGDAYSFNAGFRPCV